MTEHVHRWVPGPVPGFDRCVDHDSCGGAQETVPDGRPADQGEAMERLAHALAGIYSRGWENILSSEHAAFRNDARAVAKYLRANPADLAALLGVEMRTETDIRLVGPSGHVQMHNEEAGPRHQVGTAEAARALIATQAVAPGWTATVVQREWAYLELATPWRDVPSE